MNSDMPRFDPVLRNYYYMCMDLIISREDIGKKKKKSALKVEKIWMILWTGASYCIWDHLALALTVIATSSKNTVLKRWRPCMVRNSNPIKCLKTKGLFGNWNEYIFVPELSVSQRCEQPRSAVL